MILIFLKRGGDETLSEAMNNLVSKFQKLSDLMKSTLAERKPFDVNLHGRVGYKNILDYIQNSADTFVEFIEENNLGIKNKEIER